MPRIKHKKKKTRSTTTDGEINWDNWTKHVTYTCNQFLGTKNVFLQDTPPKDTDDCVKWNAIVDSSLNYSRVLVLFFTIGYKPDNSRYPKHVKKCGGDYFMRQLDINFSLTSVEYDTLRDWHDLVSKTVAHLGVDREQMLNNRLAEGKNVVVILDRLISILRSQLEEKYTWQAVIPTGHSGPTPK